MGGRAGGGARSGGGGAGLSSDQQRAVDFLLQQSVFNPLNPRGIKDPAVRAEVMDAIRQYAKEVGLPSSYITMEVGTLPKGRLAMVQGDHIVLAKSVYGATYGHALKVQQGKIASGESVVTGKPIAKTIVHEFGHGTYKGLSASGKAHVAATYKAFMSSKSKSGWGSYSGKNAEEFFAEGMAKGLLGKSDKWTKALRKAK